MHRDSPLLFLFSFGINIVIEFNAATNFNPNLCDWDFSGALVFGRSAGNFCNGGANCFPSGGCPEVLTTTNP